MFAVCPRPPHTRGFWVADSTLVGISRSLIRHTVQLADSRPRWTIEAADVYRPLARDILRLIARDPFALAILFREGVLHPDLPPGATEAEVFQIWETSLAEVLRNSLREPPGVFPFDAVRLRRVRGACRDGQLTPENSARGLLVHRVFLTALLARLPWGCASIKSRRSIDFAVAITVARETENHPVEIPSSGCSPFWEVLATVQKSWAATALLTDLDFKSFLQTLILQPWPDAWRTLQPGSPPGGEMHQIIEKVGKAKTARAIRQLVALDRRWDVWWQEIPGVHELFGATLAAAREWWQLPYKIAEELENLKLEALADFAAGAAHEINNPLAVIAGHAQLLLRDARDPDTRRTLGVILAQVQRAHEMIADTRLFARPPQPVLAPQNIATILETAVTELTPFAAEKGVRIWRAPTVSDGPAFVLADCNQLLVAVEAICKNAVEAVPHGGEVVVTFRTTPQEVILEVKDTGPGIPEEYRPHIFNPFYSSRQAGRGLGMGLPKAWRIVQQHGGRIEVDSPTQGGAVFRIHLPRARPSGGHDDSTAEKLSS